MAESREQAAGHGVLLHDRSGRYWLDTDSGLGLSTAGTEISSVPVYSLSAHGLVRRNWIAAYEDREGGLWFAALEGGLWHLPPHWDTFAVLAHHGDDSQSLANPSVLATASSAAGGVWLAGSRHVLEYLDAATGQLQKHVAQIDARPPDSMLESRRGLVWIGVEGKLVGMTRRPGKSNAGSCVRMSNPIRTVLRTDRAGWQRTRRADCG